MASHVQDIRRKPMFSPDRRCHWFDSNGRPFRRKDGGLGCPREDRCYFAHPTNLDIWRSARPSGDPPLQYLTNDEYRLVVGRHRSPEPPRGYPSQRPRSLSPARRRTPSRRISREREPPSLASRIRRRSVSRERESRQFIPRSSRSRSPGRGRALQRSPPPPPRGPRTSMGGPIPDAPRGAVADPRSHVVFPKVEADVTMRDATRPPPYRREDSVASSVHGMQPQTPARAPQAAMLIPNAQNTPAQPQTSPSADATPAPAPAAPPAQPDNLKSMLEDSTMQWQQISSAVANASSVTTGLTKTTPLNGTSDDASSEERAKVWSNRIELLALALRTQNECRSLENDVRDYQHLVESFSYQNLPQEDKSVIDGHLQAIQSRLEEKNDELKKILTQLTETKFWITYADKSKASPPQDGGQKVSKQIQELKSAVSQLQGLFQTVGARWEQVLKSLQSNRLNSLGIDLSGGPQGVGQSNVLIAEAIVPKELEKIRGAIAGFEERLGSLENTTMQSSDTILEQLDAIVAENMQALILAATGTVQATPPLPRPSNTLSAHQLKMLETLQQNAAVTAQQVQQLSQKVTDMAGVNEQLHTENSHLVAENAQLRQQLAEAMVGQMPAAGDSAKLDQMQAEMKALNAAVVAYLAQRPSTTPSLPSADALAEQLVPRLTTAIPKAITSELQGFLQEMLRSQQAEIKELMTTMSSQDSVEVIRGLVEKVTAMESPQSDSRSPLTTNGTGSETKMEA
ncbi:hypothetical protein GY45DRAFT_1315304 [Cubamyces sp. BRFM 1775]|nr:hypothetical protein GY45DRAFT_1315304 [Cubamyces sp. BRFM 1775]